MSILPQIRGLYVCDRVEVEPSTRNVTLFACFSRRQANRFPSPPLGFTVFATLTGGFGQVKMKLMISRLTDNHQVYSRDLPVEFRDGAEEVRVVVRPHQLVFPGAGQYAIELLADGEWMAETSSACSNRRIAWRARIRPTSGQSNLKGRPTRFRPRSPSRS